MSEQSSALTTLSMSATRIVELASLDAEERAMSAHAAPFDVEVYFDGACPLCSKEIAMLRRLDARRRRIRFTDIAAPAFDAASTGLGMDELMSEIRGRLPDGTRLAGVEVFRRLYAAVGFGPLVALSRVWGARHALELGYRVFAKNRLRLTGRCELPAAGSTATTASCR